MFRGVPFRLQTACPGIQQGLGLKAAPSPAACCSNSDELELRARETGQRGGPAAGRHMSTKQNDRMATGTTWGHTLRRDC